MMAKIRTIHWGLRLEVLAIALFAIPLLVGCGDDDTTKPPEEFAPPTNLTYVNGNNQVTLSWNASPDAGRDDFAGYNVYRDLTTMIGLGPDSLASLVHNSTLLAVTGYVDASAVNGVKYYYAVHAVKDNGDLSAPTNEIDTSPTPEGGLVILAEFMDGTRPSGLDLSEGMAYAMTSSKRDDNREHIDLYLGTTASDDAGDQPLALKSPHLVLGGSTDWADRQAGLKLLADEDVPTTEISGWLDHVTLGSTPQEIEGKVIAIRTPSNSGEIHYGKVIVHSTAGPNGQREIQVFWAHQEIPNYIRF